MSENSIGDMRTMSPAQDVESSLGRVDRYSLQERIGQGGFGSVWKAVDNETGVAVAVKALHPLIAANRGELERVRQNFVLVSRLTHPGICVLRHLHKIERIDDQAHSNLRVGQGDYLVVMDLVDGVTLTQYRLARGGTLPLDEALDMGGKIADALDYAHSQRIVHRDIKPSNIMITRNLDGTRAVKILDFGLAAEIRNSLSRVSRDLGDTTGTRPYMAPEQWSGKRQNAKSDQYALAAVLYEMLDGEVPFASVFEAGDPILMASVVRDEAPEPLESLSSQQSACLLKSLAKDREVRWPSCRSLLDSLADAASLCGEKSCPSKTEVHSGSGLSAQGEDQSSARVSTPSPPRHVPQRQPASGVAEEPVSADLAREKANDRIAFVYYPIAIAIVVGIVLLTTGGC